MLCLPGGPQLEAVCRGPSGLLAAARPGQIVVDHGTSPVALTRELAAEFAQKGVAYADAPIARTRAAAEAGTLSITVGADATTFASIRPILACCAEEITHCGPVGAGQVVKQMNNMVLFQTVVALCEALAIGRAAGVDGAVLFEALSKGSADSFALRNHGMKAILPDSFPERAFSTEYALKDLSYALDLAAQSGIVPNGAEVARLPYPRRGGRPRQALLARHQPRHRPVRVGSPPGALVYETIREFLLHGVRIGST